MEHAPKWRALIAYDADLLSEDGTRRVEAHLETCDVCREALASVRVLEQTSREVRETPAPELDWGKMDLALRREAKKVAAKQRDEGSPPPWLAIAVLAAAAVLAVVAAWRGAEPPRVAVDIPGEGIEDSLQNQATPEEAPRLDGSVIALSGAPTIDGEVAEIGATVSEGHHLEGVLHVRLDEGTGFALAGDAALHVARSRVDGVRLDLTQGRVASQVRTGTRYVVAAGQYEVHVRGTRFEVVRDGERVALTLDEGRVGVTLEGEVVAELEAPATWSSHEGFSAAAQGEVGAPSSLAEEMLSWPVLRVPEVDGMERWEIEGASWPAAGALAMRLPPGSVTVVGFDAEGLRHEANVELAEEGAALEETMLEREQRVGFLPPEQITAVVRANQRSVRQCYELQMRTSEAFSGDVALRVTVASDGRVRRVRSRGEVPRVMLGCLRRNLGRWEFPRPQGGPVTFDLPLNLRTQR